MLHGISFSSKWNSISSRDGSSEGHLKGPLKNPRIRGNFARDSAPLKQRILLLTLLTLLKIIVWCDRQVDESPECDACRNTVERFRDRKRRRDADVHSADAQPVRECSPEESWPWAGHSAESWTA